MKSVYILALNLLIILNCSYYIPYRINKVPIDESNNSFLIFNFNRNNLNKKIYNFILKSELRYGDTYLSPFYDLNPENEYWKNFYENPDDLPLPMRIGNRSQYVYFTEGCDYYIPLPIGEYFLDIELRRIGQTGYARKKIKIESQQSVYINFEEILDDEDHIKINLQVKETKLKIHADKCIYKE